MSQAKIPVTCDRCGEQGKRKKEALKEGWNRRSRAKASDKPRTRGPWACPACLKLDEEEAQAQWLKERPEREAARRRVNPTLQTIALMAALGGLGRRY